MKKKHLLVFGETAIATRKSICNTASKSVTLLYV